jgi:transposase InsO family protein
MNRELYFDYVKWLEQGRWRGDTDEWRRDLVKQTAKQFETENLVLFKKRNDKRLEVVYEGQTDGIMRQAHDHPLSGHMGGDNTYFRLAETHWWPGMRDDIKKYVRGCIVCQKRRTQREHAEADSATIRAEPFSHISIDVMGPLPRTLTGKRYIILAVDFFTKYTEAVATEEADAQTVTKFLYTDIICRHGVPQKLTSDRGTEFLNELVAEMARTYHIRLIRTTAYHPQGNGLTERTNQTVKNILSKLTKTHGAWDHYLDSALFAIRTIRQNSTTFSPFELVYGRKPHREFHHPKQDTGSYDERLWAYITRDITRLQLIRRKAKVFIDKAQERQRKRQNDKVPGEMLHIGDEVLLYRDAIETSWSAKLEAKWDGPYRIQNIKAQSVWLRREDRSI